MARNYNEFYYVGAVCQLDCDPRHSVGCNVLRYEAPTPIDPAISRMVDNITTDIIAIEDRALIGILPDSY